MGGMGKSLARAGWVESLNPTSMEKFDLGTIIGLSGGRGSLQIFSNVVLDTESAQNFNCASTLSVMVKRPPTSNWSLAFTTIMGRGLAR